jgi:hypothetical protein
MSAILLEERVVAALTADLSSAELTALVFETEAAIDAAVENANLERKKALDPVASPDPKKARASMEDAQFFVGRLKTLLPKLERKYFAKWEAEKATRWCADCEVVESEGAKLAEELKRYPTLAAQLADLMCRLAAFEHKLSNLHSRRPSSVKTQISSPELVARNLKSFDREHPPLSKTLQLPEFERSDRPLFPPPQRRDMSMLAPVPYDPRYSADWAEANEDRATEAQAEQERVAAFYDNQARERERREKADEAAR